MFTPRGTGAGAIGQRSDSEIAKIQGMLERNLEHMRPELLGAPARVVLR
jgi:hypothetical protein